MACVNYHGSSGFGFAFRDSIMGRQGRLETRDIQIKVRGCIDALDPELHTMQTEVQVPNADDVEITADSDGYMPKKVIVSRDPAEKRTALLSSLIHGINWDGELTLSPNALVADSEHPRGVPLSDVYSTPFHLPILASMFLPVQVNTATHDTSFSRVAPYMPSVIVNAMMPRQSPKGLSLENMHGQAGLHSQPSNSWTFTSYLTGTDGCAEGAGVVAQPTKRPHAHKTVRRILS